MKSLKKLSLFTAIAALAKSAEFDDIPDIQRSDRYDLSMSSVNELPVNLQRETTETICGLV